MLRRRKKRSRAEKSRAEHELLNTTRMRRDESLELLLPLFFFVDWRDGWRPAMTRWREEGRNLKSLLLLSTVLRSLVVCFLYLYIYLSSTLSFAPLIQYMYARCRGRERKSCSREEQQEEGGKKEQDTKKLEKQKAKIITRWKHTTCCMKWNKKQTKFKIDGFTRGEWGERDTATARALLRWGGQSAAKKMYH